MDLTPFEAIVSVFVGGIEDRAVGSDDAVEISDLERAQVTQLMTEAGVDFGDEVMVSP